MGEQHLYLFAQLAGDDVVDGLSDFACDIAGRFMDGSCYFALRLFGATPGFELAVIAVGFSGTVTQHSILVWLRRSWIDEGTAALFKLFSARADIGVIVVIIGKVSPLKGAIRAS